LIFKGLRELINLILRRFAVLENRIQILIM